MNLMNLNHPAYIQARKLRGVSVSVDFFSHLMPAKKAAKLLLETFPDISKDQAETLKNLHDALAGRFRVDWDYVANRAAREIWGRDYSISDYKISGIASDEFPAIYKDILRGYAQSMGKHQTLAGVWFEVWRIKSK